MTSNDPAGGWYCEVLHIKRVFDMVNGSLNLWQAEPQTPLDVNAMRAIVKQAEQDILKESRFVQGET